MTVDELLESIDRQIEVMRRLQATHCDAWRAGSIYSLGWVKSVLTEEPKKVTLEEVVARLEEVERRLKSYAGMIFPLR